ncbi:MAG: hypothetical protein K8I29_14910 [Alphaproteobacteria bacterium]|uniref:Uncharacterized protein n=1 Tax=Candidatus Nitrobium versatile TaxID=2884831 RepID=A0A953LXZ6_9BACT|nr:hypothetical protein [Candidatus Nitrobium versatile]
MNGTNKLGIPRGLSQGDFRLIACGGFGDGLNNYAHSMTWFNGHLYVGTTRGNFPLMKARLPIGLDPWPVECPENPFDIDLRAEIWRYSPRTDEWERVYKAPIITGSHGKPIPRELGYRGMLVYQADENDPPALFVSTWSPAKGPGPLLLRSGDGRNFEPTGEPGLIGLPVTTIRSMTRFKGRLYTTPAGSRGGNPNVSAHSVVYESRDPSKGQWEPVSEFGFGDLGNKTVFEMAGFGDHLYVGTLNLEGYQVWRTTAEGTPPYHWEKIIEYGAYRGALNQCVLSMCPFNGALYVGSAIQGGGIDRQNKIGPAPPELIRIFPDGHWDLLVGEERETPVGYKRPLSGYSPGFDNFFNGYFWRLCEHKGWLYLSSFDWSCILGYAQRETWPEAFTHLISYVGEQFIMDRQSGFDLYRSFDGENWVPVTTNGMGNPYNMGLRTMVSSPPGLFLGTANPFGPKVLPLYGDRYIHNPRGGCEVFLAPD